METTTLLLIGIFSLFIMLLGTIFLLISYSGLFDGVRVGTGAPLVGSMKVVYKYGMGPTKDMGPLFTEVTSIAPKLKCFGIYYDDPLQVTIPLQKDLPTSPTLEKHRRKHQWAVGCILAEGVETPDSNLVQKFLGEGYKPFTLPEVSHVVHTHFPCRTQLSIILGIYKVYPQLTEYIKSHRLCAHPWVEIYNGEMIYYMGPLAKQSQFYVPETEPDYESDSDQAQAHTLERSRHNDVGFVSNKGTASARLRPKSGKNRGEGHDESWVKDHNAHVRGPGGGNSGGVTQNEITESCGIPDKIIAKEVETTTTHSANPARLFPQTSKDTLLSPDKTLPRSASKSMTPFGGVNIVTDKEGRRASSSVSSSRAKSAQRLLKQATKNKRSASEVTDSQRIAIEKKAVSWTKEVQEGGVSSTTAPGPFSDSDTLTDGDHSMDSNHSWPQERSSVCNPGYASDSSYSESPSPYTCESSRSCDSPYRHVSESPHTCDSPYSYTSDSYTCDSPSSYTSESCGDISYKPESPGMSNSNTGTIFVDQSRLVDLSSDSESEKSPSSAVLKPLTASE